MGILSGKSFDTPVWQETLDRWMNGETSYAPEGAESFDDIHSRVRPTWDRLAEDYAGQTYVIVAHGVVVKVLACSLGVGLGPADWHHFRTQNMGINELVRNNGTWEAIRWADVRHLE